MNCVSTFDVTRTMKKLILAGSLAILFAGSTQAAIIISEVDPSGSSATNNTYNADWFELTNTGATAQDITGWKMDDNSHAFASAVGLRGVTSIAPGQSVVFVEGTADGSTDATIDSNFTNFWFGSNVPAGFTIGNYGGTSVGLSQTADEVNIYNSAGTEITGVGFGATALGVTLDNSAGVGSSTQPDPIISTNSVAGVNGAFNSANFVGTAVAEIGSPGVAAVPEPASCALAMIGMAGMFFFARRNRE
jgi:hypothetical protein